MSKFLFPGHDSPVRTVPCPRGYCHSFSSGSGDNVSITRNCYNKHEVARGHLISVVPCYKKTHYAYTQDPVQYWRRIKDDTDGTRVVNRCYTLTIMGVASTECLCNYSACNSRGSNIQVA